MKKYTFEVIINEQSDEFFEEITEGNKSGCDEVLKVLKEELQNYDVEVRLTGYEDK